MQHVVGNAAVLRMLIGSQPPIGPLQADSAQPSIQRQAQANPPTVSVQDLPFADPEQEQIRQAASQALPIWADTFANLWYTANNGALAATVEPDDPDFASETGARAKLAFGIALAGNLVWAATSLLPGGGLAVVLMSFGGATVGTGAITAFAEPPKSSQPSFKVVAATALAGARDRIAEASKKVVKDVANECGTGKISDLEEQKKRLWAKLFSTAYNEAAPIESAAAAKLAKGAQSFVAEWQAHKKDPAVHDEAWRRTEARIKRDGYPWSVRIRWFIEPSGPGGPLDEYKLDVFNDEFIKYAVESFHPTLNFG
jgi:hypothetical protein